MNRERALKILLVLVGLALFGWYLSVGDGSIASAEQLGVGRRPDDSWHICSDSQIPTNHAGVPSIGRIPPPSWR
jgi:hypothetical protein